eukprot:3826188-Karenia_brevis.AAC.1
MLFQGKDNGAKIIRELDRLLWAVIVQTMTGEAWSISNNSECSGFKAWRQMVHHFDPCTGAD